MITEPTSVSDWLDSDQQAALVQGDSRTVLERVPSESVDCVVTSPPYWGVRSYDGDSPLGAEEDVGQYIDNLLAILTEVKRVLKPEGSLWLNIGDTYVEKNLTGVPWRTAIALQDRQDWILRNDIIWNKVKGNPSAATDRLRVLHEYVFHFTKQKSYFYDVDAIRGDPDIELEWKENGDVVSPTGVSGVRYRAQIKDNDGLTDEEKENALEDLEQHLEMLKEKEIKDFRMVIRDNQRSTHGDDENLSGRARELQENGYYFLRYNAKGPVPGNIWDIIPEDKHREDSHCAVYPPEICETPILATCPEDGVVLDPFVGTGTTVLAALRLGRRGLGIDTSRTYLETAEDRLRDGVQLRLSSLSA